MADDTVHGAERWEEGGTSPDLAQAILDSTLTYLVGQSRAWLLQVEANLRELEALRDERADRVVEALRMTSAEPPPPASLRHLEMAATELLRSLRDVREALTPR